MSKSYIGILSFDTNIFLIFSYIFKRRSLEKSTVTSGLHYGFISNQTKYFDRHAFFILSLHFILSLLIQISQALWIFLKLPSANKDSSQGTIEFRNRN